MEIDNLKAFLAVAETGSFSQAADRMHLTQSAISKRVARLERQFDALTFGRTVRLTQAGDSLAARANLILQQVEDTERAIRNLNGDVGGQLSLATSHHAGLWRLPRLLRRHIAKHPDQASTSILWTQRLHMNVSFTANWKWPLSPWPPRSMSG